MEILIGVVTFFGFILVTFAVAIYRVVRQNNFNGQFRNILLERSEDNSKEHQQMFRVLCFRVVDIEKKLESIDSKLEKRT